MKKFFFLFCSALLCLFPFAFSSFADSRVAFIAYNTGNNANDGLTAATAKKSLGSTEGTGAIGVIPKEGTLVVCEKLYFGSAYTWSLGGSAVITAVHGGADYRQTEPATNPASGVVKMRSGVTVTVASNLTLRDVILFQEHETNTFVVSSGVTFTVDESVTTMSANGSYMRIIATAGSTVVVNGGTFESVSGEGTIRIGSKATVLYDAPPDSDQPAPDRTRRVCWIDPKNGSDSAEGSGAASAVRTLDAGVFKRLLVGGTVVVGGPLSVSAAGAVYNLPLLPKPLTFTSVWQGTDCKNANAYFRLAPGAAMEIASDVIFDDLVLLAEKGSQSVIRVKAGAALTVTDRTELKTNGSGHYRVELEKGAYALLSERARETFTVVGEGTVLPYTADSEELIALLLNGEGPEPAGDDTPDTTKAADTGTDTKPAEDTTGKGPADSTTDAKPSDGTTGKGETETAGAAIPESGEEAPASAGTGTGETDPGKKTAGRGLGAMIGGAVVAALAAGAAIFFRRRKKK